MSDDAPAPPSVPPAYAAYAPPAGPAYGPPAQPAPPAPPAPAAPPSSGRAQSVVRRILVYVILFALVIVSANGLSGLLERVIGTGSVISTSDTGLALSLAYTLIGVPLAGVLWWRARRRLILDPAERASLVWALYVTAMTLTSLIVATVALAGAATAGIDGQWRPGELSAALVWAGIWAWHRHMRRSAATAPTRLIDVPVGLSALFGLVVAASGAVSALATLISQALTGGSLSLVTSENWVVAALQALVWCALGTLVWWWHWFRERGRQATGAFATVLVVIVVGTAAATTLFAVGTMLFVLLRLLFDSDPFAETVALLDTAIAAGLIGGIIWAYHAQVLAGRSPEARRAGRLVIAAVGLIGAASGFGVIVNALLATFADTLVDDDPRTLLLGGVSALVVGAPTWAVAWRPARQVTAEEAGDPARRVYLVALFGASAVVAIVTLLIIGFRLFEFALDAGGEGGLVERIRAPLGLLSATALVFGYHFAIWRSDRALAATVAPRQTIGRIIVVAGGDPGGLAEKLRAETGAAVSVWRSADAAGQLGEDDLPALLGMLHGLSAPRVLVIADPDGGARVVPLAE